MFDNALYAFESCYVIFFLLIGYIMVLSGMFSTRNTEFIDIGVCFYDTLGIILYYHLDGANHIQVETTCAVTLNKNTI